MSSLQLIVICETSLPPCRSGTAAQIRNQVSAAFSSVIDGADSRAVAFPASQGSGALMLTQTLTPAGVGAQINPVLVSSGFLLECQI